MSNPGTANLVGAWEMETDGTDGHGSNDWTANGTIDDITGLVGDAQRMDVNTVDYYSDAASTVYDPRNAAFTWVFWVRHNSVPTAWRFLRLPKGGTDYSCEKRFGNIYWGRTNGSPNVQVAHTFSNNTWHMIGAVFRTSPTVNYGISFDGGAVTWGGNTTTQASTTTSLTKPWTIGGGSPQHDQDQIFLFDKALSDAELSWMYNSGAGRALSDLSGGAVVEFADTLTLLGVT